MIKGSININILLEVAHALEVGTFKNTSKQLRDLHSELSKHTLTTSLPQNGTKSMITYLINRLKEQGELWESTLYDIIKDSFDEEGLIANGFPDSLFTKRIAIIQVCNHKGELVYSKYILCSLDNTEALFAKAREIFGGAVFNAENKSDFVKFDFTQGGFETKGLFDSIIQISFETLEPLTLEPLES